MTNGLPSDWAIAKAKRLSGLPVDADSIPQAVMAFAEYIEAHEEAPAVDLSEADCFRLRRE